MFIATEGLTAPSTQELASREWWVHRAAQSAANIENGTARSEAHYSSAYAQSRIGELDSARRSAAEVSNVQKAVYAMTFVARQYYQQGDSAGAASLMQQAQQRAQSTKGATNNFVVGHLIPEYVEMDMADEAIAYAETLRRPFDRDLGFRYVAAQAAQQGNLSLALAIVDERLSEKSKPAALIEVGTGSALGGHVADVQTIVEQLANSADRDRVYSTLVSNFVDKSRLEEASEVAGRIESSSVQDAARARILAKRAETQEVMEIRETLNKLRSREEQLAVSKMLVTRLIADKKLAEADDAVAAMIELIQSEPREEVTSKFGRFGDDSAVADVKSQYLLIAEVLAGQGDFAGAKQHIRMAADAITALSESAGIVKWPRLAGVVQAQIKVGDLAGARSTLAKVPAGFGRSYAAGNLAMALADSGDSSAALEVARLITPGIGSGSSLGKAASGVCRAGDFDTATKLLDAIDDPVERGRAYHAAGRSIIEAGGGKQLADWLDANESDLARAFASLGAAEALSQEGTN